MCRTILMLMSPFVLISYKKCSSSISFIWISHFIFLPYFKDESSYGWFFLIQNIQTNSKIHFVNSLAMVKHSTFTLLTWNFYRNKNLESQKICFEGEWIWSKTLNHNISHLKTNDKISHLKFRTSYSGYIKIYSVTCRWHPKNPRI